MGWVLLIIVIMGLFVFVVVKTDSNDKTGVNAFFRKFENIRYCAECGNKILEGRTKCSTCGTFMPEAKPIVQNSQTIIERKTLNKIILAENESIVRSYHCSYLSFPSCDGYLSVTNRRVIFHGHGGANNRIVNEVLLESVSGITSYYGGRLYIGRLIYGIILGIIAIVLFASASNGSYYDPTELYIVLGFIASIISSILLISCYKKVFVLKLFSSKANNSPIDVGNGPGNGTIGNSALYSIVGQPTGQTDKMMSELGAMISDLQQFGDVGIENWKEK